MSQCFAKRSNGRTERSNKFFMRFLEKKGLDKNSLAAFSMQNSILLWYQKGTWQATLEFHLANTFDTNLLSSSIPNSHSAIRPKSPDLNYIFGTFSYLEPES